MTLVWIAAGEASGDVLGARLVAALRRRDPTLRFRGLGGEHLAAQGMDSLFPIRELAVMGLLEVLPQLRHLSRRLEEAAAALARDRPRLLVTIDSPGFTLRLARRAKALGIPVVHYVAPQVWAWRPGRARRMAESVDRILALLPFEAPFFAAAGIPVDFVGHPILESESARGDPARFPLDGPGLAVLPGSRRGEVARHLPLFAQALPAGFTPVVALAGTVEAEVRAGTAGWGARYARAPQEKADALAACTAGLIKSGTSSLEAAVAGLPHVVAYRMNPLTGWLARRLVKLPHASLVNLLARREVVPECLLEQCTPDRLRAALRPLLEEPAARDRQRAGFREALEQLTPPQGRPSEAAADAVLRML
ncbi:lipid-A-disaccharide synthase [Roseococcus sp. DSY-14]|uniref:lipid-A-disaccharide synthase n=1 Tax=Roseococcus sp. DSY-14 TaxID=3369650 RepID=UPI00387B9C6B